MKNIAKTNAPAEERSYYWENMKGLVVFVIIMSSLLFDFRGESTWINRIALGFHSFQYPALAYFLGVDSQNEKTRSKEALCRLLAAYVLFDGLFLLRAVLFKSEFSLLTPYYHLWLLPALLVWRLAAPWAAKKPGSLLIAVAAALLIGLFPDVNNILGLRRIIAWFPFFLAGYRMDPKQAEGRKQRARRNGVLLLILAAVTLSFPLSAALKLAPITSTAVQMAAYTRPAQFVTRAVLFLIPAWVIMLLLLVSPKRKLPLLSKAGGNCLTVYLLQRYFALIFCAQYPKLFPKLIYARELLPITFVLSVLLLFVLSINWLTKKLDWGFTVGAKLLMGESETVKKSRWAKLYRALAAAIIASTLLRFTTAKLPLTRRTMRRAWKKLKRKLIPA